MMQQEMDSESMGMPIHLFGINGPGTEGSIPDMVDGRMIPLLQDTIVDPVSGLWGAQHFDLVVLDADNMVATIINLGQNDLTDPANYAAMKEMLLEMATTGIMPMHGGRGPWMH